MVKHTQTIRRQKPTNCLSVFDHFVGLALKGLMSSGRGREKIEKLISVPPSTSYKNCFQYASVPLIGLINDNALSLVTNLSIVPLKLLLTVPAVSEPGLILCIAKIIDERIWCCSYTDLEKNIQSVFDAKC